MRMISLLSDANFENYFLLAALISAKIDGVFEKNGQQRKVVPVETACMSYMDG